MGIFRGVCLSFAHLFAQAWAKTLQGHRRSHQKVIDKTIPRAYEKPGKVHVLTICSGETWTTWIPAEGCRRWGVHA
jgi:hypothetical protein